MEADDRTLGSAQAFIQSNPLHFSAARRKLVGADRTLDVGRVKRKGRREGGRTRGRRRTGRKEGRLQNGVVVAIAAAGGGPVHMVSPPDDLKEDRVRFRHRTLAFERYSPTRNSSEMILSVGDILQTTMTTPAAAATAKPDGGSGRGNVTNGLTDADGIAGSKGLPMQEGARAVKFHPTHVVIKARHPNLSYNICLQKLLRTYLSQVP